MSLVRVEPKACPLLNNLRIGPKLGLMMLVPLLAVVTMLGIVWQDGAAEIRAAERDREVAESVSAVAILPRLLLSETLVYDIGDGDPSDLPPDKQLLLNQIRAIIDAGAERYRDIPPGSLAAPIRAAVDEELAAVDALRAKADAGTITDDDISQATLRQRELNADALQWLAEQEVFDPNGSWRLLVVTAPGNATLLDAARVAFRAMNVGTLSARDAAFLRDTRASYTSLSQLQDSLLSRDLDIDEDAMRQSPSDVSKLIALALELEGQEPPRRLSAPDLLRSYRLGLSVLTGGIEREQSLAAQVADQASLRIDRTRREQLVILASMLVVLLLAVGAMVAIARNIVTRLVRVSEQAERLNAGVIDGQPATALGSDEIAVLGTAMNGVSDLYRRLVAQTEAIAAGRLDDKALREPLPGALGAALQSGVDRVATSSAELLKLATHDELTGVLDRSGLARSVEALSARRGEGMAAAFFVDLDGFKDINDTFGHAAGDTVLIETAERLRRVARTNDAIARLGGDEFVVLAAQVSDAEGARLIAERMSEVLSQPFPLEDGVAEISASVGWSLAPPGESLSQAIENADREMYRAKRTVEANAGR